MRATKMRPRMKDLSDEDDRQESLSADKLQPRQHSQSGIVAVKFTSL